MYLNTTDNQQTDGQFTSTSSTTVGIRNGGSTNQTGTNYVMYCWTPIAGFSSFGKYTGNGSTDGPFVYTGFRPKFIMIKRSDGGVASWAMFDTSINPYNQTTESLYANKANASDVGTGDGYINTDIVSNGFKIRQITTGINFSSGTFIYMAFAENPFQNALAR